jgi:hypothetical protein
MIIDIRKAAGAVLLQRANLYVLARLLNEYISCRARRPVVIPASSTQLELLSATQLYLRETYDIPLGIIGSA